MFGWKDLSSYDLNVLTLLEEVQLEWLVEYKDHRTLGILLNEYPHIAWFIMNKAPNTKSIIESIMEKYQTTNKGIDIQELEKMFINSLEDWLIYVTEPDAYDRLSFNKWNDNELLSITDFKGKTVLDIGSGTGSQLFRIANKAKTVYGVEPIGNLRKYLKVKAKNLGHKNVYIVDGLLTEIPFADNFADILVTGHVFGDNLEKEYLEMMRVVKSNGMVILMPGNSDSDNIVHEFLLKKGFMFDRFMEPGPDIGHGWKRKYWITKK